MENTKTGYEQARKKDKPFACLAERKIHIDMD